MFRSAEGDYIVKHTFIELATESPPCLCRAHSVPAKLEQRCAGRRTLQAHQLAALFALTRRRHERTGGLVATEEATSAACSTPPEGTWLDCPLSPADRTDELNSPIAATDCPTGSPYSSTRSSAAAVEQTESVWQDLINDGGEEEAGEPGDRCGEARTTIVMRNLPKHCTRQALVAMLDDAGFSSLYDFIYVPTNFKIAASWGYAFINLVCPEVASSFWVSFDGRQLSALASNKACRLTWNAPQQGLQALVERYRNSPIMHALVPAECKPVVLKAGQPVAFPSPTRKVAGRRQLKLLRSVCSSPPGVTRA